MTITTSSDYGESMGKPNSEIQIKFLLNTISKIQDGRAEGHVQNKALDDQLEVRYMHVYIYIYIYILYMSTKGLFYQYLCI